ncbi:MAG: phage virion morphogenesis protein [Candidatus Aminicenantes bacterium]|nr:MAG: phage virion morphogenesis protein [Candidatus Aminicenantes bacterium]
MLLQVFSSTQFPTLTRLKKNLSTRMPHILDGIGVYMVASVIQNFDDQGRPEKWKENAPATLAKKKGNLILQESGLLKLGITFEVDESENSVQIGPSGPSLAYAAIQKFGGQAGWNYSVTIPARDYLLFQESDEAWINQFVRNEVFYAGN